MVLDHSQSIVEHLPLNVRCPIRISIYQHAKQWLKWFDNVHSLEKRGQLIPGEIIS